MKIWRDRCPYLRTALMMLLESVEGTNIQDLLEEHNYCNSELSDIILSYMAKYVGRKSMRFTKCDLCLAALKTKCVIHEKHSLRF